MPKLPCGCIPDHSGFGYCDGCCRKLREKIWKNMSPEKKAYDRHFAPGQSRELDNSINDYERAKSCSCHINPPCSYCTDNNDENEENNDN